MWRWSRTAMCCGCSPPAGSAWPPEGGRLFRLDTGTVSTLGDEHDEPVVLTWNVPPTA